MRQIKDFDLNLLVTFEKIYTTQNIAQAAEALGMSTASISNSLTKLRTSLDDTLFVRSGNGVAPTELSKTLIVPIRSVLQLSQKAFAITDFDPAVDKKHFVLAAPNEFEATLMLGLLNQEIDNKGLSFECSCLDETATLQALENGSVDLGIVFNKPENEELCIVESFPVLLSLISRKGHPDLGGTLTVEDLGTLQFLDFSEEFKGRQSLDALLEKLSIKRVIKHRTFRGIIIPQLLNSTNLVAILPTFLVPIFRKLGEVAVHELPVETNDNFAYLVSRKSSLTKSEQSWFISQIKKQIQERICAQNPVSKEV